MSATSTVRAVIEEELVTARINKAIQQHPLLHGIYEGLKWRIARRPFGSTTKISDSPHVRLAKAISWAPVGLPSITILYEVTHTEIIIKSSRIDWPKASL